MKPLKDHIPQEVMVEPVEEPVPGHAGSHIDILALRRFLQGPVGMEEVAEGGRDRRSGRKLGQGYFQHRVHDPAKVHQDAAVRPFFDRNGLQHFLDPDRGAHHRRGYDAFHGDIIHRAPFGFHCGLDPFSAEAVRLPGAQVFPAAPGSLPGIVGP